MTFKASTRMKRQKASSTSISHLKLDSDILSKKKYVKVSCGTNRGWKKTNQQLLGKAY